MAKILNHQCYDIYSHLFAVGDLKLFTEFKEWLNKQPNNPIILNDENKAFTKFVKDHHLSYEGEAIAWKGSAYSEGVVTLLKKDVFRDAFRIIYGDVQDEKLFEKFEKRARTELVDPQKQCFRVSKHSNCDLIAGYQIGEKKISITPYGVLKYSPGYGSDMEAVEFYDGKLYRICTRTGMRFKEVEY
jgi:hypothetical protein